MKNFGRLLLLIFFLTNTFFLSAQEWKWRNASIRHLDLRTIEKSDYSDSIFLKSADFRKSHFSSYANFGKAQFDSSASFFNAQFDSQARFSDAQFSSTADFRGAQFSSQARFSDAQFSSDASFTWAQFDKTAHFFNAEFSSTADFLGAQFSSDAYFGSAQFSSQARFSDAQFSSTADFRGAQFSSRARFSDAQFSSDASFTWAQFDKTAHFFNAEFSSAADFGEAQFSSRANFVEAQFSSDAYFLGAQFSSRADFVEAQFSSDANFMGAKFSSDAYFLGAQFSSDANFREAQFDKVADFREAQFDSLASFSEAHFKEEVFFEKTKLPPYLNFTGVTDIAKTIDFTKAAQRNFRVNIALQDADISKMRFRYKRFKLWFPGLAEEMEEDTATLAETKVNIRQLQDSLVKMNKLPDSLAISKTNRDSLIILIQAEIDKLQNSAKLFNERLPEILNRHYEIKAGIYEDVLRIQEENSFHSSYEILDKEYRAFQYTDPGGKYGKYTGQLLNWLDKNWWGYGYDKELIIRNVVLIYLLLSFINAFFIKHLVNNMYTVDGIIEWASSRNKWTIGTYFKSIPYSLFYTAVIFFGFKFDIDKLNYQRNLEGWRVFNLLYFILIYTGGLVCLAYLANYVITV